MNESQWQGKEQKAYLEAQKVLASALDASLADFMAHELVGRLYSVSGGSVGGPGVNWAQMENDPTARELAVDQLLGMDGTRQRMPVNNDRDRADLRELLIQAAEAAAKAATG